jgi:hypothetical protein
MTTLRTTLEPVHFGSEFELDVFRVEEKKTVIMQMRVPKFYNILNGGGN